MGRDSNIYNTFNVLVIQTWKMQGKQAQHFTDDDGILIIVVSTEISLVFSLVSSRDSLL